MVYKIHTIILIAISVDFRHGEGLSDPPDAKISGKLESTWKLRQPWVGWGYGCKDTHCSEISEHDCPLIGTMIASVRSVIPVMERLPLSRSRCDGNGEGVVAMNCKKITLYWQQGAS